MNSIIFCCVISIIVINCNCFFAYHICMYVAIGTIKMYLSINYINKCIGKYKIAQYVNTVDGLTYSISTH
jgi:hypothetical protein